MGDAFVKAVWVDPDSVEMDPKLRAALRLCEVITLRPEDIAPEIFTELRELGVADREIETVVQVCCAFNMVTRIADALEFDVPTWDRLKRGGKIMYKRGYK